MQTCNTLINDHKQSKVNCDREVKKTLETEKKNLIQLLKSLPNFSLEMKWDFDSNVVPLISVLAPSGSV